MARSTGGRVVRVLLIVGGALLLLFAAFSLGMPKADGPRVEVTSHIVGVLSPEMYAWIIRTPNGAALIDTGMDPTGAAILAELSREGLSADKVHTVLLTHGHFDHTSAAVLFKNAKIYAGRGDVALVKGEESGRGLGAVFAKLSSPRPLPKDVLPLDGTETLNVDGESIRVIATPGHTAGSMMYLDGDVLFTGDSLSGGGRELSLAPRVFSQDSAQNRQSLKTLESVSFTIIADGHTGATANAHEKLLRFLRK